MEKHSERDILFNKDFILTAKKHLRLPELAKPVPTEVVMVQGREILLTNGDDILGRVAKLQKMITFVATCSPATLFRKISTGASFLREVWDVIRE